MKRKIEFSVPGKLLPVVFVCFIVFGGLTVSSGNAEIQEQTGASSERLPEGENASGQNASGEKTQGERTPAAGLRYVEGEFIIKLRDNSALEAIRSDKRIRRVRSVCRKRLTDSKKAGPAVAAMGSNRVHVVKYGDTATFAQLSKTYRTDPRVEYIQRNYIYEPDRIPNDSSYSQQYAHRLTGIETAWNTTVGSEDIVVAVIGTGVDIDHPDLSGNIWQNSGEVAGNNQDDDGNGYVDDVNGWDFYQGDNDPRPAGSSHETMVSGIIAAVGNNGIGICGVNWSVRIMPIRAAYTSESVAAALEYAVINGAHIINMSFGNYTKSKYGDFLVKEKLDNAFGSGILTVATAGNDRADWKRYPAALWNVMAVAATDQSDYRALWNNGYSGTNFGYWVDIAAPGSDIYSTSPSGQYAAADGTSFAAPYVAGLGALLLSGNPTLTHVELRAILENTAASAETGLEFFYIGTGRVNAAAMMAASGGGFPLGEIVEPVSRERLPESAAQVPIVLFAHGDSYQLHYRDFSSEQWVLIGQGNPALDTGQDGFIHASLNNPGIGTYVLRLTTINGSHTHYDKKIFGITGGRQQNWPTDVMGDCSGIGSNPICMDIDEDGKNEIIQSTNGMYTYIWNDDGTLLTGWPKQVSSRPSASTSAVGDVDGDGDYEVVTTTYDDGGIYVWHWQNGQLVEGSWPKHLGYMIRGNPVLADLDGDGDSEIIVPKEGVQVYQHDGTLMWSFVMSNTQAPLAAADLDGDGDIEILLQGWTETVILDHRGNEVSRWYGGGHKAPVIADLDNDGNLEIISYRSRTTLRVLIPGPRGELTPWTFTGLQGDYGATSVGDLDGDGKLEIFVADYVGTHANNKIYAFDYLGNPLTAMGFPKDVMGNVVQNAPTVADVDGDGNNELLIASSGGLLFGWERTGSLMEHFPRLMGEKGAWTMATAADLDKDGDIDIMLPSIDGIFYIWDFAGPYHSAAVDWGMYRHDPQNSGLAKPAPKLEPVYVPEMLPVGQTWRVKLNAYNPGNMPLHFYVRQMPDGAAFDSQTQIFSWTPTDAQARVPIKFYFFLTDGIRQDHIPVSITPNHVESGIIVTSPVGGEVWTAGENREITWMAWGWTGNVNIDYSTAGTGGTFIPVAMSAPNTGSYNWTLPDTESNQCVVRVSAVSGTYTDTSDSPFTIKPRPSITITAPGGGAVYKTGMPLKLDWTVENLEGYVTAQLYRDNTMVHEIGTAAAQAGTLTWMIPVTFEASSRYRIRLFKDTVEDYSDNYLSIIRFSTNADFNGDGKTDILWHYTGAASSGINMAWLLNGIERIGNNISLSRISDLDWEMGAAGDFNGDGKTDILWRYYGAEGAGLNMIWLMDGVVRMGGNIWLPRISDSDWKIKASGDFNSDGKTDILWRYHGAIGSGLNMVWLMDGTDRLGGNVWLRRLADLNWRIEATGDFNGDAKTDILWRFYGEVSSGVNMVWLMDGVQRIGDNVWIPREADLNWKVVGTGDFNGDGKSDILWRYYGDTDSGRNKVWFMDGTTKIGESAIVPRIADINWKIEN
jgi:hypothetical protein